MAINKLNLRDSFFSYHSGRIVTQHSRRDRTANNKLKILVVLLFAIFIGLNTLIKYQIKQKASPLNLEFMQLSNLELTRLTQTDSKQDIDFSTIQDLGQLLRNSQQAQEIQNQKLLFSNSNKVQWLSFDSEPIALKGPFRLLINFATQNQDSTLTLSGRINSPNTEWWQGIHRVYLSYNKSNHQLGLSFKDGTNEASSYYFAPQNKFKPNQTLLISFTDPQGKVLIIEDLKGEIQEKIELTKVKELNLPNGLFPDKVMHVGINVAPKSSIIFGKLYYYETLSNVVK